MNLLPDLFSFAYVPGWYCQLDELAGLALPEPWRFRNPDYYTKNTDTPILERYIHSIFKKQVIDFNEERNPEKAADYLHVENEFVCFHTGLYTRRYKAIYGCFDRNKRQASMLDWYFRGFSDELSQWLKYISPLPKKPSYDMAQYGVNYNPEWPIRVNIDHILGDGENLSRLPASIRDAQNLPLLLETAVELARRKAVIEPGIVVPQGYQGRVQYLLSICLTDMENPDLAMTLTIMDGYYLGNTCLTLEMAYLNARLLARPVAPWLAELVMQHCRDNAATLSEHDWYSMITNLAVFEGGERAIHELSAPYPRYKAAETTEKIRHFLGSGTRPITCRAIAEKGFSCPRMADGSCACKAPAALCYQPMALDELREILSAAEVHKSPVEDVQAAKQFVKESLYNIEPLDAGTFIEYELRQHFHLKTGDAKALASYHRELYKAY